MSLGLISQGLGVVGALKGLFGSSKPSDGGYGAQAAQALAQEQEINRRIFNALVEPELKRAEARSQAYDPIYNELLAYLTGRPGVAGGGGVPVGPVAPAASPTPVAPPRGGIPAGNGPRDPSGPATIPAGFPLQPQGTIIQWFNGNLYKSDPGKFNGSLVWQGGDRWTPSNMNWAGVLNQGVPLQEISGGLGGSGSAGAASGGAIGGMIPTERPSLAVGQGLSRFFAPTLAAPDIQDLDIDFSTKPTVQASPVNLAEAPDWRSVGAMYANALRDAEILRQNERMASAASALGSTLAARGLGGGASSVDKTARAALGNMAAVERAKINADVLPQRLQQEAQLRNEANDNAWRRIAYDTQMRQAALQDWYNQQGLKTSNLAARNANAWDRANFTNAQNLQRQNLGLTINSLLLGGASPATNPYQAAQAQGDLSQGYGQLAQRAYEQSSRAAADSANSISSFMGTLGQFLARPKDTQQQAPQLVINTQPAPLEGKPALRPLIGILGARY